MTSSTLSVCQFHDFLCFTTYGCYHPCLHGLLDTLFHFFSEKSFLFINIQHLAKITLEGGFIFTKIYLYPKLLNHIKFMAISGKISSKTQQKLYDGPSNWFTNFQ